MNTIKISAIPEITAEEKEKIKTVCKIFNVQSCQLIDRKVSDKIYSKPARKRKILPRSEK